MNTASFTRFTVHSHKGDSQSESPSTLKSFLNGLYYTYSRTELIAPDPLQFLRSYTSQQDIETAALIAASLAYGRVSMILRNTRRVLTHLAPSPFNALLENRVAPPDFVHRFTDSESMTQYLKNIREIFADFGTVESCVDFFVDRVGFLPGLSEFSRRLNENIPSRFPMMPSPESGSACKRLFMFLRWMVRHDDVDLGLWKKIPPAMLLIPVDTHMLRIARILGLTKRKNADLKCVIEITEKFREICPDDPARYDFVLTRFGIRAGMNFTELSFPHTVSTSL